MATRTRKSENTGPTASELRFMKLRHAMRDAGYLVFDSQVAKAPNQEKFYAPVMVVSDVNPKKPMGHVVMSYIEASNDWVIFLYIEDQLPKTLVSYDLPTYNQY